jgi:hypothetical protein
MGENWDSCDACGMPREIEVTAVGKAHEVNRSAAPTDFWGKAFRSLGIDDGDPSVATILYVIGGIFLVAAAIYFLATAGFPPGTTTTFEYQPNGTVTESTSPDTLEFLLSFLLFVIGAVLVRAGAAASSARRK